MARMKGTGIGGPRGPAWTSESRLSRRGLLRMVMGVGGVALMAACSQAAPAPADKPKPAEPAKPTAAPAEAKPAAPVAAPAKPAEATKPAAAPAAKTGEITRGGRLRIGQTSDPRSLHSTVAGELTICNSIYDPLINLDHELNPQPGLAESWETPDEKTMILKLRKGVRFHDGTEFDAEAVKFNLEDIKDPNTRSLLSSDLEPIQSIDVVDTHTVKLNLRGGGSPLIAGFGMQAGHMLSPTARKKYGEDYGRNPVGSGPYQFVEWVQQDHITLKRNLNYWNKDAAYLDEVIFRIVPDPAVRLTNVKAGELDYTVLLSFKDVAALRTSQDIQLLRTWAGADRFIFNNSKPPFDNKPLRQALQLAIDRQAMHRTVFFETGVVGYGPVHPPGSWAFDADWKPAERPDHDKARAKLKEGGHPDGFEFKLIVSDAVNRQIAEAYQAMFAPLGVKLVIDQMENAKRINDQQSLNYEASLSTWQTTADPGQALWTPYHTKGSANYLRYSNPRVDELLDKAIATYDKAQRRAFYREVDHILFDDAPCPIPYHRARFDAASAKVKGIESKAHPQLDLRSVWLSK